MSDEQDEANVYVASTPTELREAMSDWIQHLSGLQDEFAKAKALAGPYEGMGAVANMPGLAKARQDIQILPAKIEAAEKRIDQFRSRLVDRTVEEARVAREGRDFWFRRFMLSLQIGNGAAFLATIAGLLQADKDVLPVVATLAWAPVMYFALGVTAAGLLPLLMFARQALVERPRLSRTAQVVIIALTTLSMGFFALGAGSAVVEVTQLRKPAIDAALRAAAESPATKTDAAKIGPEPVEPSPAAATQKRAEGDAGRTSPRPEVRTEPLLSARRKPN